MTAYIASFNTSLATASGATTWLSVTANNFELKLVQAEISIANIYFSSTGGSVIAGAKVYRYDGGTASGGSALTPAPLRQGGPAATATARSGGVSFSGTQRVITQQTSGIPAAITYAPPFDLTVSPGSSLVLSLACPSNQPSVTFTGCYLALHFEELRLSWHY